MSISILKYNKSTTQKNQAENLNSQFSLCFVIIELDYSFYAYY